MINDLSYSKLLQRYPVLNELNDAICESINKIIHCFQNGSKIIVCGNGGSSSDAEHFCGELQKSFIKERPLQKNIYDQIFEIDPLLAKNLETGLPAIALPSMNSSLTAISNDLGYEYSFAQQVLALAKPGDIVIGFSTSGNSKNVVNALKVSKALKLFSISFTGQKSSQCSELSTLCLNVPSNITHEAQELHLPIYHSICMEIENYLF